MEIIDPKSPVMNTLIFYIAIVCIILMIKPKPLYCDKTEKFKLFSTNDVLCLPTVCIGSGVVLYFGFLMLDTLYRLFEQIN